MHSVVDDDDDDVNEKTEEADEEEYEEIEDDDLVRTSSVQVSVMRSDVITHFVYFISCIGYRGVC